MHSITEKRERALGVKLFIKADRCNSPKCVTVRRPTPPGAHGQKRHKAKTEYGNQLQEKQKIQLYYGLTNHQMMKLFTKSKERIIQELEQRLDRVVFYLGFARSPRIARQLITHGHIMVGEQKVTIPSYHVTINNIIRVRPESRGNKIFEDITSRLAQYEAPTWLTLDKEKLQGTCRANVTVQDIQFPFDIDLVGQFFSR